jgi:hypothetical protein
MLTAVLTTLHPVRVVAGQAEANVAAFHDGLLVCAGVAVVAALAALTIRDADAAATMIRPRRQSPVSTADAAGTGPLPVQGSPAVGTD